MEQQILKIKYHTDNMQKLDYIAGKSDWIDLRSAEDVTLKQGEFHNFGIIQTNHMGVIDETYCGDNDVWRMPALAVRDTQIRVNDRICQFRIQKHQPQILFEEVQQLGNPDRGGIGSTGKF